MIISSQGFSYPEDAWNTVQSHQTLATGLSLQLVNDAIAEAQANQVDARDQRDADVLAIMTQRIVQLAPLLGLVNPAPGSGPRPPARASSSHSMLILVVLAIAAIAFMLAPGSGRRTL